MNRHPKRAAYRGYRTKHQPEHAAHPRGVANPLQLKAQEPDSLGMDNAGQIYSLYRSQLLGFIQQRVGDRELAKDILHDIFVKILGRQDSLRDPARITAWLYQVTRNAIIDRLRSSRACENLPQQIADDAGAPTAETRLAGFLRPMIDALPQIYRDAIILSDLDGVPLKQIAEREGVTVSAIKSRVQRGRRMLENLLHDCCTFEFSHRGDLMDFWPNAGRGRHCDDSPASSCGSPGTKHAKAAQPRCGRESGFKGELNGRPGCD
jgi:RNA polymerase sigma-70 factor (ECF subfamily)